MLRLRWLILLLLVAAIFAGVTFRSHVRAAALVVARRDNGCPVSMALNTASAEQSQARERQRILSASRLVQTEPAGLELWETPAGRYWVPKRERSGYWLADMLSEQADNDYAHGDVRVRSGDTVLDCGANVGTFSRVALQAGAKLVIAIEPGPDSVECLRRNFSSEIAAGRLVVYPKGVWDQEAALPLIVDRNGSLGDGFVIRRPQDRLGPTIALTRIDTLVGELKLERVDFIKMDIEGSEKEALRGAAATLRRLRPRLTICAYHKSEDPVAIPELVHAIAPAYAMQVGSCVLERRRITPKVMFFE